MTTTATTPRQRLLATAKRLGALTALAGTLALGATAATPAQPTSAHGSTVLFTVITTWNTGPYWGRVCQSYGGHTYHNIRYLGWSPYYGDLYEEKCVR